MLKARARHHLLHFDEQLLVIPGLREVVIRAGLQRAHRHLHRAVGGDHDDGRLDVALAGVLQHVHAGVHRHFHGPGHLRERDRGERARGSGRWRRSTRRA